jgi:hypothetical protein
MMLEPAEQARRLNHGWIGPEHYLLALLAEPSVATEALGDLGVTHDRVFEYLQTREGDPDWPEPRYDAQKGLSPNPAAYKLAARAEGFAFAGGHRSPAAEHWLLAMVYAEEEVAPLLHQLGASQQAVLGALRQRGIGVPDVDPPAYRPWRGHRRVEVTEAELRPVIDLLMERYPPGAEWRWGFNWRPSEPDEPRRAWVGSEEGLDLEAIVAEARQRLDA